MTEPSPQSFLPTCERAARRGAEVLQAWRGRVHGREKGPKDIVTEADLASQKVIEETIGQAYPDHDFLGEEGEEPGERRSPYRWIVDPLDGTTNYVHGMPNYAVSVALQHGSKLLAGVVYDPTSDECFSAALGGGATLGSTPLATSRCDRLREALVAASFSTRLWRGSREITRFNEMLLECQAVRRLGSAALNLCYVAAGRLDGYWATSVKAWDVAAGALILREAGGRLTNVSGGPFDLERPDLVAAATGTLHTAIVATLQR